MLRRETRNSFKVQLFPSRERVPNTEIPRIMQSDNIPRERLIYYFLFIRKESIWRREFHFLAFPYEQVVFVSFEHTRNDFHKGKPVAVFRVHIGMNFKHKTCEILFLWLHDSAVCLFWLRIWSNVNESIQQFPHPKIIQRRTKEHRLLRSCHVIFPAEFRINRFHQLQLISQSIGCLFAYGFIYRSIVNIIKGNALPYFLFLFF